MTRDSSLGLTVVVAWTAMLLVALLVGALIFTIST
jgi:hypothetical protein